MQSTSIHGFEWMRQHGKLLGVLAVALLVAAAISIVWNGKRSHTIDDREVTVLAWRPDGRQIAAARYSSIDLIDCEKLTLGSTKSIRLAPDPSPAFSGPRHVEWSPDLSMIAVRSDSITVYDANDGRLLLRVPNPRSRAYETSLPWAWRPDGRRLAIVTGKDDTTDSAAMLWNADAPKTEPQLLCKTGVGDDAIAIVRWESDGRILVLTENLKASYVDTVKQRVKPGHTPDICATAILSPDRKMCAILGSDQKTEENSVYSDHMTVEVWNTQPHKHLFTLSTPFRYSPYVPVGYTPLVWSPSSKSFAMSYVCFEKTSGTQQSVQIWWDAATGKELCRLRCPTLDPKAWIRSAVSPDLDRVVISGSGSLRIYPRPGQ